MNGSGGTAYRADELQRGLVSHCYRMLGSITDAVEIAAASKGYEDATRACLQQVGSRPLPSDLAAPSDDPEGALSERSEILWLEPIPADLMDDHPIDLGLIAALQRLPPVERAVTVLHLEGRPSIADLLSDISPVPVNVGPLVAPDEVLLARYRAAFEQYDVPEIVTLFTDDAIWRCRRSRPGSAAPATSAA